MTTPKFPNIRVAMVGEDGNAFAILGRVQRAMRKGGCSADEVKAFLDEATSGDYNHLLNAVMKTVDIDAPEDNDDDEEELDIDESDLLEEGSVEEEIKQEFEEEDFDEDLENEQEEELGG